MLAGQVVNIEQNNKYEWRRLTKVTWQQKISNTLLYPVLVPTIAAHHLTLPNFGFEENCVQVPHCFFVGGFALRGLVDDFRC